MGAVHARRLQSGRLGTYVAYLIALVVVLLAGTPRGDRVSAGTSPRGSTGGRGRRAGAAAAGPDSALEGAAPGTSWADAAPALSRAATSLEQEHRHRRRDDARLPPRARRGGGERRRRRAARSRGRARAQLGTRARRARARRCARTGAVRPRGRRLGRRERLLSDGREPRPRDLRLRRSDPHPLARCRRARRGNDRPPRHGRGDRRRGRLVEPALALGGVAFAVVVLAARSAASPSTTRTRTSS